MPQPSTFDKGRLATVASAVLAVALAAPVRGDEPAAPIAAGHAAGPPLWRVSKDDHVLWLFGTLTAVPKAMKFSPAAVEAVIADAQESLSPPGVRATTLKPVPLIRLWLRVRELSGNPNDQRLAEVLPADLYDRYAVLRDRYARRDRGLEELRPIVVAGRVYASAVEAMGLVSGREVENGIERMTRRAGVEATDTRLHGDPEVLLEQASHLAPQAELDCFAKVLARIEVDEQNLAARARAWAIGDVDALRQFDYPDIRRECLAFPGWPPALGDALDAADERWLESAVRALTANRTTFGTLDLRDLMTPNGLLARLRERGYDVEAP